MKFISYKGENLSKLSLGTVQFGLEYGIANRKGKPTQESVDEIIAYVRRKGINCFDTAQAYGDSEKVLGKAIKEQGEVFVISKLRSNSFREDAIRNVENSLTHLNIPSLYALLLHDSALLFSWSDVYGKVIEKLKEEKKIQYFGVSIYNNEEFEAAINNKYIEFIQIPFNLFDQRAITQGWLEKAKEHDKLIFIRSIFLQGLLLMDIDDLPSNVEKAREPLLLLEQYAQELQMRKSELALSFVDAVATDALLLFGCEDLAQAKENISNYDRSRVLDIQSISKIIESFSGIDEKIYDPTKW